jgi:hypothetical protein
MPDDFIFELKVNTYAITQPQLAGWLTLITAYFVEAKYKLPRGVFFLHVTETRAVVHPDDDAISLCYCHSLTQKSSKCSNYLSHPQILYRPFLV